MFLASFFRIIAIMNSKNTYEFYQDYSNYRAIYTYNILNISNI